MGRRKNSVIKCLEQIQKINYEPPPLQDACPTLDKVVKSSEMHLFDLSSLQLELERLITSIMERLACLSAESKGHELPPEIMQALHLLNSNNDLDTGQTAFAGPSLVVKANPDKPLTLIISQRSRTSQNQSALSSLDASIGNRSKPGHSVPYARRSSRSSVEEHADQSPASSPDKSQSASYAIPNKFWELMEPYCADITEANIAYLEGLIRSYQDMEASYFQLPPLHTTEIVKSEPVDSIAAKRPKREAAQSSTLSHNPEVTNLPDTLTGFASASNVVHLARCLEKELKVPCSESSTLGKLSQSLLSSCYQENIMFTFTESVERLHVDRNSHQPTENVEDLEKNRPESTTDWRSSTQDDSDTNITDDDEPTPCPHVPDAPCEGDQASPLLLPASVRAKVTARASQPLKNLAKQMHVSSSYRVEKKIAQAIDELGLFPLNLIHSPSVRQPDPMTKTEDYCALMLNNNQGTGSISRLSEIPIARLKIKASTLKSPIGCQDRGPNSAASPSSTGSPTAKRRRRSTGLNKHHSPRSNTETTNRLSNGIRGPDSENNRLARSGIKPEHGAELTHQSVNGIGRGHRSSHHKELKQLRSIEYRGKLRNSFCPQLQQTVCNGSANEAHNQLPSPSPKSGMEHRLVNGLSGVDAIADDDYDNDEELMLPGSRSHPTDDDDGHSVTSRTRVRLSHADQSKNGKSISEALSSPSHYPHVSSRSSSHTFSGDHRTESERRYSSGNSEQPMVNGDLFTFSQEDTALLDEKRQIDGRLVGELQTDVNACPIRTPTCDHADIDPNSKCTGKSSEWQETRTTGFDSDAPRDRLLRLPVEHKVESDLSFLLNEFALDSERLAKGLISSQTDGTAQSTNSPGNRTVPLDEVGWAILQRQHELRMVCAANHSVLRRLVQAARRDVQRQEIQRRLAIADADVIEAYNKLESYRPLRKPPLKRDRDMAYKALKERRKILKELEAFDACSP